ncbi:MAG: DUF6636 domain-containing protein [Alphaproteobacteria bacterium]
MRYIIGSLLLALSASPAVADGFGFQTPSGNIYCNGHVTGGGGIGCTIVSKSGSPPKAKPSSCSGYWGHDFNLDGNGSASLTCGSRPSRVDYTDVAPYGVSADFGNITCTSKRTGLTCKNKRGHGFTLSRRIQSVF